MNRVAVFCGSSTGARPEYLEAARALARVLADQQLELVYGGARVGLMGTLARTMLECGGRVIGVMPSALVEREVAMTDLTDLRVVGSMHERKALMTDLADAFIAMPGGLGTFEELFEVLTWSQLGMHGKPTGLLNTCGYFDRLAAVLDHAVSEQFIEPGHRLMLAMSDDPAHLLTLFRQYEPPRLDKARLMLARQGAGPGA